MSYRIISKEKLLQLSHKEAYIYCCIALNSKLDIDSNLYISHIKEETLAEMASCSKRTVTTYIQKFARLKLLKIKVEKIKGQKGIFNRNTYYINKPATNWFRLEYDFLQEEIPAELKGYLILLKSIGFQGSNTTLYSLNEIAKRKLLQIGLNKLKELTHLGITLNVIQQAKKGYTIIDKHFYEDTAYLKGNSPTEKYLMDYYNEIVGYCKKLQIKPPKYDKRHMLTLFSNCPNIEVLIDKMNNRNFPKNQINSLMYFIKTLNFNISETKSEQRENHIIMP